MFRSCCNYINFRLCVEITCTTPAAAENSGIVVSVSASTVGGFATYSCQEGRRLVGPASRKCLTSGLWEGSQPVCECNYLFHCNNLCFSAKFD